MRIAPCHDPSVRSRLAALGVALASIALPLGASAMEAAGRLAIESAGMIAATPQLMRSGNSVTLWDEIAPPSTPRPVPVDAGRAAQGSVASDTSE